MEKYEYLFAGNGLSGLTLAYDIISNPLLSGRLLMVDRRQKNRNDRTWGFWHHGTTVFNDIVYRKWKDLIFAGPRSFHHIHLQDFSYQVIRGIDLYNFLALKLKASGRVDFLNAPITAIREGKDCAVLCSGENEYTGKWLFNSTNMNFQGHEQKHKKPPLYLQFNGWTIKPDKPVNTDCLTFMDFRTPQKRGVRFFYMVPYKPDRLLIEYTAFLAPKKLYKDHKSPMERYIKDVMGIESFEILEEERGCLPLFTSIKKRRQGSRVLCIGNAAGHLKATTGYSFKRIQEDSLNIVRSLVEYKHPFRIPGPSRFYSFVDRVMVLVMTRFGHTIHRIFDLLFKKNSVNRILNFLDETASLPECLEIMQSLPAHYFYRAIFSEMGFMGKK
ncbi:MAG: hypothetical protein JXR70_03110 [Spirochaetales bacterium]|nr:hypothetical protein [Spirochaetales bacterium]